MSKNYTSILPVIHSNGTSATQLYRDYCRAMNACVSTITAMQAIEFNGRDYYPLGEDAFSNARKERDQIITGIRAAFEYCLAHADQAQKAVQAKEEQEATRL